MLMDAARRPCADARAPAPPALLLSRAVALPVVTAVTTWVVARRVFLSAVVNAAAQQQQGGGGSGAGRSG